MSVCNTWQALSWHVVPSGEKVITTGNVQRDVNNFRQDNREFLLPSGEGQDEGV